MNKSVEKFFKSGSKVLNELEGWNQVILNATESKTTLESEFKEALKELSK